MHALQFRKAVLTDLPRLLDLINQAYREDSAYSWSNEAKYVSGLRINEQQLREALEDKSFHLYVAEIDLDPASSRIVASIGLTFNYDEVEIGTFCVDPTFQNTGIGKAVLSFAEKQALLIQPELHIYVMYVLDIRAELIAYYQRRGYSPTAHKHAYPLDANVGQPFMHIELLQLIKKKTEF
jgi:GNAT superfamily N-acetyltransferase